MSIDADTPSRELTVRPGTPSDTPRIVELLKLSLGEGTIPRDERYWSWKHVHNPFGESAVLLAESGTELVGLRAFMRWRWAAAGESVAAVRAVDTATHPDWQGQGIFSKLTRSLVATMRDEGIGFVFNTPNEKSRPGYLKMGWSLVGRLDLWLRPLRPLGLTRAVLAKVTGRPAETPGLPDHDDVFQRVSSLTGDTSVRAFLQVIADRDDSSRLRTPRTVEYLRWRYEAIPGINYHSRFEVTGDDGAILVFRTKSTGSLVELRLCEVIVGPSVRSRRIARELLASLHAMPGVDYLSAMASPGTTERTALIRSGYLPALRLGPYFTVNHLNPLPLGIDPVHRGSWQPAIGDLELF